MKPIHLNLASRPYEDKRIFIATVVGASIVVAALLFVNIDTYLRYRVETRTTRARIATLAAQTEQENRRNEIVSQQLKQIDLVALSKQTSFINAQLAERSFSWSELLDDLEKVLADDVRILSIVPSFRPDGIIHLELQLEAKTSEGLVDMLNRFNRNPRFANPFPTVEANQGGSYRIALGVDYRPVTLKIVPGVQQ